MTEQLSIQGEQQGGETAYVNFTGTNAELASDKLPEPGDEQVFTVRARCKKAGHQEVNDKVQPFRTMKVTEIIPGDITKNVDPQMTLGEGGTFGDEDELGDEDDA